MVFENLGLGFAWGWVNSHGASSKDREREKKAVRKKHLRRADQVAAKRERGEHANETARYYPGLVNISGTYCFLNSTLQALASLSYLHPHIEAIHARAERLDVPTPIIDALRDILTDLNTPSTSPRAMRPIAIINALSAPVPGKRSALFSSREHQDAQELFQLISESVKNEARAVDEEASRDRGLGDLSRAPSEAPDAAAGGREKDVGKGVFDGLTANRRSCVECGYTEAVMHFSFDNWQLAVPRIASCRLEDCLSDYTRLELLTDCICRRCSMLATHRRLVLEADRATEAVASASAEEGASASKKKRAREARKHEARVKAALEEGRIEEDVKGVKMEKVFSRCSTKQAMIARPPPILALHLNRSIHYAGSGVKNTCRVLFPELLDLTPYTTSGQLSTTPSAPLSIPPPAPIPSASSLTPPRSTTPTPADHAHAHIPRILYRLAAVVCHYGAHSFGHYVAYRRKPPSTHRLGPPVLRCPIGCECAACLAFGPVRDEGGGEGKDGSNEGKTDENAMHEMPAYTASRWLRISDDTVDEVGLERVLAEGGGVFMLFYERVVGRGGVRASGSEDTIMPGRRQGEVMRTDEMGKSVGGGGGIGIGVDGRMSTGARVVRSVHVGRSRSRSPSVGDLSGAAEVIEAMSVHSARGVNGIAGVGGMSSAVRVNGIGKRVDGAFVPEPEPEPDAEPDAEPELELESESDSGSGSTVKPSSYPASSHSHSQSRAGQVQHQRTTNAHVPRPSASVRPHAHEPSPPVHTPHSHARTVGLRA
ncbi:cysteine proteinase [Ramaria rubella]|nr:cysteine proteinase [Ramaria rubella]